MSLAGRLLVLSLLTLGVVPAGASIDAALARLPLHFEANHGQLSADFRFVSRGPGYALGLRPDGAALDLRTSSGKRTSVAMRFVGAHTDAAMTPEADLPGKVNYFRGRDRAGWRTNVPTYERVRWSPYDGVDVVFYGSTSKLEYDFVVAPHATPDRIAIAFDGVDGVVVDTDGSLLLKTPRGLVRQSKPHTYQEINGRRVVVPSEYVVAAENRVSFTVGDYDRTRPLVIDPALVYSTYMPPVQSMAIDSSGNAYIITSSLDLSWVPRTTGAFQTGESYGSVVLVMKINAAGSQILYSTFLDSRGDERAFDIAVDGSGNAHVLGFMRPAESEYLSHSFPLTSNAWIDETFYTTSIGSREMAFVTKLNATGSAILYSTLHPPFEAEYDPVSFADIAVDPNGHIVVAGSVPSGETFTTAGAVTTFAEGKNGYITRLNPAAQNCTGSGVVNCTQALAAATYFGDTGDEKIRGMGVGPDGSIYVTGQGAVAGYVTSGAFQTTDPFAGDYGEASFVAKLNSTLTAISYFTYLREATASESYGRPLTTDIVVDSTGSAHVVGWGASTGFPTSANGYLTTARAAGDAAFYSRLNTTGTALLYSTVIGSTSGTGGGMTQARSIAVATESGTLYSYVGGQHNAPAQFPTTTATSIQDNPPGDYYPDLFVIKINPAAATRATSRVWATLLGGTSYDTIENGGLAADGTGNVFVAGSTSSEDFPLTPNSFQWASEYLPGGFLTRISSATNTKYTGPPDSDADGTIDHNDNCISAANSTQVDTDGDSFGDACDHCPAKNTYDLNVDSDGDGDGDGCDNCTLVANGTQADSDGDGVGNACDNGVPTHGRGKLVFQARPQGANVNNLFLSNDDGSGRVNISNTTQYSDFKPSFSPDGSRILFLSDRPAGEAIRLYTANADGSGQTMVPNSPAVGAYARPEFSPDGTKIAFGGTGSYQGSLMIMNADGSGEPVAVVNMGSSPQISWSRDGTKILYSSYVDSRDRVMVVAAAASAQPQTLAIGTAPSYSPNGQLIAWANGYEAWVMNTDGTGKRPLANAAIELDGLYLQWTPDGRFVTVNSGVYDDIWSISASTGNTTQMTNTGDLDETVHAWQPVGPPVLVATATGTTTASVSWTAVPGVTQYVLERKVDNVDFAPLATVSGTTRADSALTPNKSYLYRVRAASGDITAFSNVDHATTASFVTQTLTAGPVIRASHFTELRTAINALRSSTSLPAFTWTDASLTGVIIQAAHLTELRTALTQALSELSKTIGFTDGSVAGVRVKAVHVQELRNALK